MPRYSQFLQKNQRSILFWVFIIISFPLAIAVIGYAAGYKINTNTRTVVASSALAIETIPKDVSISLNDELEEKRTPYVSTVAPGLYDIDVHKDGYLTWSKQILFEQGKSIIFPDIILFKRTIPIKTATEENNTKKPTFSMLDEKTRTYYEKLGWQNSNKLKVLTGPINLLINEQTQSSYLIASLTEFDDDLKIDSMVNHAEWLSDKALLIATDNELWIYNVQLSTLTLLTRQSKKITSTTWHPDGGYVFYSNNDGLFAIEVDPRDQRQIWQLTQLKDITDLQINSRGNIIFFNSLQDRYELELY